MAARTPAEVLAESRRNTSLRKRQRVLDTIRFMLDDGEPISFSAVARAAKVSTWLVYAGGVREHVQAAKHRGAMRQQLGHQLDQISNRKLTERITQLTEANRKLEHELVQLRPLTDHVQELERDLAATRASLRQMIRERALEPGPNGPESHA